MNFYRGLFYKITKFMQIIQFQKERVQNMALFFVNNTCRVGNTKLMKLYYFSDRKSYLETGFTISGLEYIAKRRGPAIEALDKELNKKAADLRMGITSVIKREAIHGAKIKNDEIFYCAKKNKSFDPIWFSPFELDVLKNISKEYKDKTGAEMSMKSHDDGLPWVQTWDDGKGNGKLIDFDLDIENYLDTSKLDNLRFLQQSASNFKDLVKNL